MNDFKLTIPNLYIIYNKKYLTCRIDIFKNFLKYWLIITCSWKIGCDMLKLWKSPKK